MLYIYIAVLVRQYLVTTIRATYMTCGNMVVIISNEQYII